MVVLAGPTRTSTSPVSWLHLTARERRDRWIDLANWVDWLIEAYRLPPTAWSAWWTCPGACEELSAVRAWHHELVDVEVDALTEPVSAEDDPESVIEWYRHEQNVRQERARSLVDFHDALWRMVARLASATAESKPLLLREAEATDRTVSVRDDEAVARRSAFEKWLAATVDANSPSDLVPR